MRIMMNKQSGPSVRRFAGAVTVLAVAAGAVFVAPAQAAEPVARTGQDHVAPAYALELLAPTSDGVASAALGVNDAGDVVGITRPTSSARPQSTVVWTAHGDHHDAEERANLSGSTFSRGFDVNDAGTVVGEAFNGAGSSVPVRWKGAAGPEHVTTLNANGGGVLRDVNDAGVAVGVASGKAVQLGADDTVTVLAAPSSQEPGATTGSYSAGGLDDDGAVVGRAFVTVPHGDHSDTNGYGVVWRAGVPTLLAQLAGATSAEATAVDGDHLVGTAVVSSVETAVSWDEQGAVTRLPAVEVKGFPHTAAKAVNDDGLVVGQATKLAGNASFGGAAVAWDAHGAVDLNTRVALPEGVRLVSASDVNGAGQVVGTATTPDGQRAYVLTPMTESSVTVGDLSTRFGRDVRLPVTVRAGGEPAEGTATVSGLGPDRTVTLVDGAATVSFGDRVPVGTYRVDVTYAGRSGVLGSSATAAVTVAKASTTTRMTVSTRHPRVKRTRVLTVVTVKVPGTTVEPDGLVRVKVPGRGVTTLTVRRGVAWGFLPTYVRPGRSTLTATFVGTSQLAASASTPQRVAARR